MSRDGLWPKTFGRGALWWYKKHCAFSGSLAFWSLFFARARSIQHDAFATLAKAVSYSSQFASLSWVDASLLCITEHCVAELRRSAGRVNETHVWIHYGPFGGVTALSVMGHPIQGFGLRIYRLICAVDSFPLNSWPIALQFLNKAFWVLSCIILMSRITALNTEL